jgi:hypothetical protein
MKGEKSPMRNLQFFSGRRLMSVAVLTMGLLSGPLTAHRASAAIGLCRTDPIVQLSNGTVLQLRASIADDAADIRTITYAVRAPKGTSIVRVVYTTELPNGTETISFSADNPAGTYDTDTFVSTTTRGVDVTAQTVVPSVGSGSVSGQSGQHLMVHLSAS